MAVRYIHWTNIDLHRIWICLSSVWEHTHIRIYCNYAHIKLPILQLLSLQDKNKCSGHSPLGTVLSIARTQKMSEHSWVMIARAMLPASTTTWSVFLGETGDIWNLSIASEYGWEVCKVEQPQSYVCELWIDAWTVLQLLCVFKRTVILVIMIPASPRVVGA